MVVKAYDSEGETIVNKRDTAILDWVRIHRPDMVKNIESFLSRKGGSSYSQAVYALMAMAFEAGRRFQTDNPILELDNPNVY